MSHHGALICLNCLSFGSDALKTRNDEHRAIVDAFKSAKAAGSEPTAICLQDYEWNTETGLQDLINQVNEVHGSTSWKAVRQWGNDDVDLGDNPRDAVVLYDSEVYIEKDMDKHSIGGFSDPEHLLAGMQDEITSQLSNFDGRWAGAILHVNDEHKRKFFILSFHGRRVISVNGEPYPVQTAVKASMAKEFIGQAANVSVQDGSPALIAGCWNTNSEPLRTNPLFTDTWNASVHLYDQNETPRRSSLDGKGMPKGRVDYAVAVHPNANACTDLNITEVHLMPLAADIAANFHHQPLLMKFTLDAKA